MTSSLRPSTPTRPSSVSCSDLPTERLPTEEEDEDEEDQEEDNDEDDNEDDDVYLKRFHLFLKRELQRSAEGEIPYARLDGRAEPTGQPLYTGKSGGGSDKGSGSGKNGASGGDDTAIVRITDKFRVRRDRCPADRRW